MDFLVDECSLSFVFSRFFEIFWSCNDSYVLRHFNPLCWLLFDISWLLWVAMLSQSTCLYRLFNNFLSFWLSLLSHLHSTLSLRQSHIWDLPSNTQWHRIDARELSFKQARSRLLVLSHCVPLILKRANLCKHLASSPCAIDPVTCFHHAEFW